MRIETNLRLAKRNRQIAQYLFFASFGLLIIGLIVSNTQIGGAQESLLPLLLPAVLLPLAFISTMVSVRMTNLWIRVPRPENALQEALKGIGNKSVLYSYYLFPARHVLITPHGVFALITRFQDGQFTVEGDQWRTHRSALGRVFSIFRFDSIGNPSNEARTAAQQVKALIDQVAEGIDVQPIVVFVDPRAQVNAINPSVPVLYPDSKRTPNLKNYIRDYAKANRPSLSQSQIEAFEQLLMNRA
jgi:hypothetical protein